MSALEALDDAPGPGPASPGTHRPQSLLLSFFGALVLDAGLPPLPSATLLDLMADLGVAEAAGRATLKRMTQRGLLSRGQVGRTAEYTLTPLAEDVLREATGRVDSPTPFEHPEGEWTLLSYSVPESRRDLRHRVRARLTWAGFGGLRDGLWIAPGRVDVAAVLGRSDLAGVTGLADAFAARALPGTDVDRLVHRAWDVPAVRTAHLRFVETWSRPPAVAGSLAQLTLLGADWLSLLRTDPGLPAGQLGPDWPAATSTATYRRVSTGLGPAARAALERSLRASGRLA
ncbi:PaaX family transcriptional regulator [Geodermatophilus sp. SYSU D01119]